jgi:hypothetical protein
MDPAQGPWLGVTNAVEQTNDTFSVALSTRDEPLNFLRLALATPTISQTDTVTVIVTDANGVTMAASQTLPVQATPHQLLHPPEDPVMSQPWYGCESPSEPDTMVTLARHDWQLGMGWLGLGGGKEKFCWVGNLAWPGDFIRPNPPGSLPTPPWIWGDADYANWGIDSANIVLVLATDGDPDNVGLKVPGSPQSPWPTAWLVAPMSAPTVLVTAAGAANAYPVPGAGSWGPYIENPEQVGPNDRLYWLCVMSAGMLDETDSGGVQVMDRWGPAFNGLHILASFTTPPQPTLGSVHTVANFVDTFVHNMLSTDNGGPQTIIQSWFAAAASIDLAPAAVLLPVGAGGVMDFDDFYLGKGSQGPPIPNSLRQGWFYLRQK